MDKEMKIAFWWHGKEEAKKFNESLKERMGIDTDFVTLYDAGELTSGMILVPTDKYKKSLAVASEIDKNNPFDIEWVDDNGNRYPLNYLRVMRAKLPKGRDASSFWLVGILDCAPIDIKEYVKDLSLALGDKKIIIKYNERMHAIEFLIRGTRKEHKVFKKGCAEFDRMCKNSPFTDIVFYDKDGNLVEDVEEKTEIESNLRSYFNESLFKEGIFEPMGANIVTKPGKSYETGYKYSSSSSKVRNFVIDESFICDSFESMSGKFILEERKDYDSYWNSLTKTSVDSTPMPFIMIDSGSFTSKIEVVDDVLLTLVTNIGLFRNVVGYNFDGKSVRDSLFPNTPYDDTDEKFQITEYFLIIDKGRKLLHYSDASDLYEVYDLPKGWSLKNGIPEEVCPIVSTDPEFSVSSSCMEEIMRAVNSRAKYSGKSFAKKYIYNLKR